MAKVLLTERIQAVQPSATLKVTALAKQLKAEGKNVISLAAGEPDFDTPESAKQAAVRAIQEGFTKYTPTTGMPPLKEAIASYLSKTRGLDFPADQINVTCGAKQALFNLLQVLVQSGDEVLFPAPYWVSYPEMARLASATPVPIETDPSDGFRLTPEALEKACTSKSRCLILNSPSNPTGAVLDAQRLQGIAQVAQEKGLWVISDEIYSQLIFVDEAPSIAAVSPEIRERTFIVDGVSKAFSMTGWRIGFLAGPLEVVKAAARLQDHSTSCPTSISQKAAIAALDEDPQAMLPAFKRRREFLINRLKKVQKIGIIEPEGAFYCFVDISKTGLDSTTFSERLLQEALVAVIPGAGFGADGYVRLSFALGDEALAEGLDRMDQFIQGLS